MNVDKNNKLLALLGDYGYTCVNVDIPHITNSIDSEYFKLPHGMCIEFNVDHDIPINDIFNLDKYVNSTHYWKLRYRYCEKDHKILYCNSYDEAFNEYNRLESSDDDIILDISIFIDEYTICKIVNNKIMSEINQYNSSIPNSLYIFTNTIQENIDELFPILVRYLPNKMLMMDINLLKIKI